MEYLHWIIWFSTKTATFCVVGDPHHREVPEIIQNAPRAWKTEVKVE